MTKQAWLTTAAASDTDDCLLWPFGLNGNGYGRVWRNGKMLYPHRIVCEMVHGPAPFAAAEVAHGCRTPRCCNPQHIRWATSKENSDDQRVHGTLPLGEQRYNATLTDDLVRQIRAARGTHAYIASQFGLTRRHVGRVRDGSRWSHVT